MFSQTCIFMTMSSYFSASVSCWYLLNLGSPVCKQDITLESAAFFLQLNSLSFQSPDQKKTCQCKQNCPDSHLLTHVWFPPFQKLLSAATESSVSTQHPVWVVTFVQGQSHPAFQHSELHVQKCDYTTQSIYSFWSTVFVTVYKDYRKL